MERLGLLVGRTAVTEIRGMGLMIGIQLNREAARDVVLQCLDRGVIVNDVTPSTVRLLPPLVLKEEEAMEGVEVLADVLAGLKD
jgi:acetylornithine aminotransferase